MTDKNQNPKPQKPENKADDKIKQEQTKKNPETKEAKKENSKQKKEQTQKQQTGQQKTPEQTKQASQVSEKKQPENKKQTKPKKKTSDSRTIFTWTFVLLIFLIGLSALCFINKLHIQKHFQALKTQADSLNYLFVFYKNGYQEKDSAYNVLLTKYNNLLQKQLAEGEELNKNKEELLKLQQLLRSKDSVLQATLNAVKQALVGYGSDEMNIEIKNGKLYITMQNKLLFPSGSDVVSAKGVKALKKLAKVLKQNPNLEIMIEGHTDNVPISKKNKKYKDNWDLSVARAVSVVRILTQKFHIPPERLAAVGRGEYHPIAPNTTPQGRAKNRRIEIIIYPNMDYLSSLINQK